MSDDWNTAMRSYHRRAFKWFLFGQLIKLAGLIAFGFLIHALWQIRP